MENPIADDCKKLENYGFSKLWEYRLLDGNTMGLKKNENEECKPIVEAIENCKPVIYAIVIENRAKYIGSTQKGKKRGWRLQFRETYTILSLKRGKTKRISAELKRGYKTAKLYSLLPPAYNHKGLVFLVLRDLENALIKDLKTTKKDGGWNRKVE